MISLEPNWWDKLTKREFAFLVITMLIVIGVGYYQFEYSPIMKKRERLAARTQEVLNNLESFKMVLNRSSAEKLTREIQRTEGEIKILRHEISDIKSSMTENVEDIVQALGRQAKTHRAEMLRFNSHETRVEFKGGNFRAVTMTLAIKSHYQGVGRFVKSLESIPAVLSIKELRILRTRETHPLVESELIIQLLVS
ncbi:hypothetical protein ACTRW9_01840 [Nitrospina sp. 32_T5]|uniref:hypothetical protein n=1 Tax=unclassified Nitrospina TaxID=2638683 RepID=UPI003F957F29